MKIIDSHHHLWQLSGGPLYYPWLQDEKPHEFFLGEYRALKRDYLPPDYRRDAVQHEVVKTVHVEAECSRDHALAQGHARARGVPQYVLQAVVLLPAGRTLGLRGQPPGGARDPRNVRHQPLHVRVQLPGRWLRVGYTQMFDDLKRMTAALAEGERWRLFHDNAAAFYRL